MPRQTAQTTQTAQTATAKPKSKAVQSAPIVQTTPTVQTAQTTTTKTKPKAKRKIVVTTTEKVAPVVEAVVASETVSELTSTETVVDDIEQVKSTIENKINEIRDVLTSDSIANDLQRGLQKSQITALRRLRSRLEHIKKEAHSTKKLILDVMKNKKNRV
jgi:hypothetical protein